MKIERRTFNNLLSKMRVRDAIPTHETIREFGFDEDVVITLDDGDKIITSPERATKFRNSSK